MRPRRGCTWRSSTQALARPSTVPAAISTGLGSATLQPLAIVNSGGLVSATILTLLALPVRYVLVPVGNAVLFAAAAVRFGADWVLPAYLLFFAVLLAVSVIDLQLQIIPNRIVYPAIFASVPLLALAAVLEHASCPHLRAPARFRHDEDRQRPQGHRPARVDCGRKNDGHHGRQRRPEAGRPPRLHLAHDEQTAPARDQVDLAAGDDTTDIDSFAALDGLEVAVRVAVASSEAPTSMTAFC